MQVLKQFYQIMLKIIQTKEAADANWFFMIDDHWLYDNK